MNPANGIVALLPAAGAGQDRGVVTLEIADAARPNRCGPFTSKKDTTFKKWDGGPRPEPVLPKPKGLNRFVWDMRYPTMPGVPGVYIEASYRGHKAAPGTYRFTLKRGRPDGQRPTPTILRQSALSDRRGHLRGVPRGHVRHGARVDRACTRRSTACYDKQTQLEAILAALPAGEKYAAVRRDGEALLGKLKAWDDDMVQRKSKAYDDVENFPQQVHGQLPVPASTRPRATCRASISPRAIGWRS